MLTSLLRNLPPAGEHGLEGLVLMLLADAWGLEGRLEPSGRQDGRDGSFYDRATGERARIDLEVKRYGKGNSPSKRMLLGELTELRRERPDTELWVLVSTAAIPAKVADDLQDEGFRNNIDVLILDCSDNGVSALELLAARRQDLVLRWLGPDRLKPQSSIWRRALYRVRAQPAYQIQEAELAERLVSRYAAKAARAAAQRWLREHVEGRRRRAEGLNQSLGRQGRAPEIARPANAGLWRQWLSEDPTGRQMLALLGSEGDGKTWTAIDILLAAEDRIPLIATSNMFDDGGAVSLIARALAQQCGGDADRWRNRLEPRKGRAADDFSILLLIDGLNEAPNRRLDLLLNELMTDGPFAGGLDLIVTCRTPFWTHRVQPLLVPGDDAVTKLEIGPFDEEAEWPEARAHLGPGAASLPQPVIDALRNPRLWSFAYDLKDQLGGLEEITLERLLVEHWRLRIAERETLRVDPEAFNMLIGRSIDMIRKLGKEDGAPFLEADLEQLLRSMVTGVRDFTADLAEVRDGIFFRSAGAHKLVLKPERVPVALGLLLCERILDAGEQNDGGHAVRRAAGSFLDDLPASDRVEIIVRTAIFALLAAPGNARALLPTLLRHWVGLQNFEPDFYRALAIVAAAAPEQCIAAIEAEACDDEMTHEASAELSSALRGRRDRSSVRAAMLKAVERWLRSWSAEHFPSIARDAVEGLLASDILWVETLDDVAADFLAALPHDDWPLALAWWARRRRALDRANADIYHYDDRLSWLGMSGTTSDAEAEAVLARIRALLDPKLDKLELECAAGLLRGNLFSANGHRYTQELGLPRWEETEEELARVVEARHLGKDPGAALAFAEFYKSETTDTIEAWLQLERLVLEHHPELLAPIVQGFLAQALERLEGTDHGAFAQFIRHHALLLGEAVVPLIRAYVAANGRAVRSQSVHAGRAVPAGFIVTEPEAHLAYLASLTGLAALEQLDLTGLAAIARPRPPEHHPRTAPPWRDLVARGRAGDADAALIVASQIARSAPAPLEVEVRELLLDRVEAVGDGQCGMALAALDASGDGEAAARFAAQYPDAASVGMGPIVDQASALIVRGAAGAPYAELRTRLAIRHLPAAARADGSPEAIRHLTRDFDAILHRLGSSDWPVGTPSWDLVEPRRAHTAVPPDERMPFMIDSQLHLEAEHTRDFLDTIGAHLPGYRRGLIARLDQVSDGALLRIEQETRLVSLLADDAPAADALRWMRRLARDPTGIKHKGLFVSHGLRLAFSRDEPGFVAWRDELADPAWTDQQLLDLVCLAGFAGRDAWLERRIAADLSSAARSVRARGILLRGWRGSVADREWLAAEKGANGYLGFALEIARARCARRFRMLDAMDRYQAAASDADAWLAWRGLVHHADRRLWVEADARGWPDTLPRAHGLNFTLGAADADWLIGRVEGDLNRGFAGVSSPPGIPPWGGARVYRGQD